jgi:hypothetical protein
MRVLRARAKYTGWLGTSGAMNGGVPTTSLDTPIVIIAPKSINFVRPFAVTCTLRIDTSRCGRLREFRMASADATSRSAGPVDRRRSRRPRYRSALSRVDAARGLEPRERS